MCGICGYLTPGGLARDDGATLGAMTDTLTHRGPDARGVWSDAPVGIALGHRRLAIIDCTAAGAQPMHSASARHVVAYNGEIYNAAALAGELRARGHRFRGHSDTEVLLAAVDEWGLAAAVPRLNGIFAFALWDRRDRTLHLVRDHLGVKPLYYGWVGDSLVFGSELKALVRFPGFAAPIDRGALALFLRHNCVPAPHTIYAGVRKLLPGTILSVPADDAARARAAEPVTYWSARAAAEQGARAPLALDDREAVDRLEAELRRAIGAQMVSDVPLGAFLSGGVDSATVVALMQAQSDRPVRTFTIGNDVAAFDEAEHARAVARHLGTDHTELYVTSDDALAVIPELPRFYDEPFADSSQIPTYLVSRLARAHVTVALSGDGGDELFAGYNRHVLAARLWRRIRRVPRPLRRAVAGALTGVSAERWDRAARLLGPRSTRTAAGARVGFNLHKLAEVLDVEDAERIYLNLVSHWKQPAQVVLGAEEPPSLVTSRAAHAALPSFTEQMMYLDSVTYLPDDILTKVDRASMAVSLEARVPLLDPRVYEFAWSLPLHQKLRDGRGKWALREVLYRHVPRALVDRPKAGFGVPIGDWLRGPLRGWAEELLHADRLRADGFLDAGAVRRRWEAHLAGTGEWQYHLWDVLMFQAWYHDGGRDGAARG